MTEMASFDVQYTQYLDKQGQVTTNDLPALAHRSQDLIRMYRLMVRTRVFDAKAIALQRTGQLGTYASCLGQEAIGAAVGEAMRPEDVLFPSYREQAAQFARGVRMSELLLYWGGDERGSRFEIDNEDFPVCVPIATQLGHAVGAASAFKIRGQPRVAMCGDGASSKGDFYESLNVAGVWRLPVVFIVSNNQWAISVPLEKQTAASTIAQKAIAAGIPGLQVDGNDLIAIRSTFDDALRHARAGCGPTLIEALTYRLTDHTTADDASRYRTAEEVQAARELDPILRMRVYLTDRGAWSDEDEANLTAECESQVQTEVDAYLATTLEPPQALFDHLYAELPSALQEQRQFLIDEDAKHG